MGFSAAAFVVYAYSQYQQVQSAKDSANAQKEANRVRGVQSDVEAQRARIAQVREARIRRAQVLASAGNEGLGAGTSGVVGATSSITSQEGSNIGFINQTQGLSQEITAANNSAADAQSKGAQWQAIGGISGSIFQGTGGFTTIFGGNTNKKAGT